MPDVAIGEDVRESLRAPARRGGYDDERPEPSTPRLARASRLPAHTGRVADLLRVGIAARDLRRRGNARDALRVMRRLQGACRRRTRARSMALAMSARRRAASSPSAAATARSRDI